MSVTTKIILDLRGMNKETKSYPGAIRVTFLRQSRTYRVGVSLTKKEFKSLFSPKAVPYLSEKLRKTKEKLENEEQRAINIINKINNFSFDAFYLQFNAFRFDAKPKSKPQTKPGIETPLTDLAVNVCKESGGSTVDYLRTFHGNQFGKERKWPRNKSEIDFVSMGEVAFHYGEYIKELEAMGCTGTLSSYLCSLNSLLAYKPKLRFADMTKLELSLYEKWMEEDGATASTISMYLRNFRKIYRDAIRKHVIPKDKYPFGLDGYVIPSSLNVKKARSVEQIQLLYDFRSDNPKLQMARDFWILSYLGNGMNPKDIALLKGKRIHDDFIRFKRAKTIRTTKSNPQEIAVYLLDEIKAIIGRQGNLQAAPNEYVFPIITDEMDAYERDYQLELFCKLVNDRLEGVCEDLNIDPPVKFEDARHCTATQLKRSGADMEYIRELMGHKNLRTTMNYLGSFLDETLKEQAKKLIPGKKVEEKVSEPVRVEEPQKEILHDNEKWKAVQQVGDSVGSYLIAAEFNQIAAFASSDLVCFHPGELEVWVQLGVELLPDAMQEDGYLRLIQSRLPAGWRRRLNTQGDWKTNIFDNHGRLRVQIEYKPGERITTQFKTRYIICPDPAYKVKKTEVKAVIWDNANGKAFVEGEIIDTGDYADSYIAGWKKLKTVVLDCLFPDWQSPVSYWSK
ncbi:MAG: site-specific integrase [Puia sp.]|nr:site-specific integrase [Puia sp.]